MDKWKCLECGAIFTEYLSAPNPFDAEDIICACPECKTVEKIVGACDVDGCKNESSCGWSSSNGYRRTCHKHTGVVND
jgi:hypothetical protein